VNNSRVCWLRPDDPPDSFPPVSAALREPNGLLAVGGDLSTARLLQAYRSGIFPWYEEGQPLLWWSPDPRCVFLPGDFHESRRLRQIRRRSGAEIRVNTAFGEVMRACAGPRRSAQGTWITPATLAAFDQLHQLGWAHSIEVWDGGKLTGGLYGLAIGKVFFGESMFSASPNASKFALQFLATKLQTGDFDVLDCQVVSVHLQSLGARTLARDQFMARVAMACEDAKTLENWPRTPILCSRITLK